MGQKFAAYNAQGAVTGYYDSVDSPVPEGVETIEITEEQWQTCIATQGWTVVDGALVAPVPPTTAQLAAQALIQSAQVAMTAGVTIASTSTPALNGTYACTSDMITFMNSEVGALALNGTFADGSTSIEWADMSGALHEFTVPQFKTFAAALGAYVSGVRKVAIGVAGATLPAASVTIA